MSPSRDGVMKTAERLVARGKIEAAIKEYRKVLKDGQADVNTLNRVGDLYARIHRIDEAVRLYGQIAERYAGDGFYVKAIAVYKKIHRLDPTRLEIYEKLADLYHRQGLVNDARGQYQVLADYYIQHRNAASAITIYQKMTELEPDNPAPHFKLAELYQQQKLLSKAVREYGIVAEIMIAAGHIEEATQFYHRALEVDASDIAFITEAVMALKEAGQTEAAEQFLAMAVERNPGAARVAQMAGLEAGPTETVQIPSAVEAVSVEVAEEPVPEAAALPAVEAEPEEAEVSLPALEAETGPIAAEAEPERSESETVSPAEEPEALPTIEGPGEEAVADEHEEFVLDWEDEEPPASLVQPPPDMLEARDAAGAELEQEIELVLEEDETEEAAQPVDTDVPPAATVGLDHAGTGIEAPAEEEWTFEPEPELALPAEPPGLEAVELEKATAEQTELPDAQPEAASAEPAASVIELDHDMLQRAAEELEVRDSRPVDDLLAEAEVFVKYGLQEKALERLQDVLEVDCENLQALSQLIFLLLQQEEHERVMALASGMAEAARRGGAPEAWQRVRERLMDAGYGLEGDRVIAAPGATAPPEAPAPEATPEPVVETPSLQMPSAVPGIEAPPEGRFVELSPGVAADAAAQAPPAASAPPSEALVGASDEQVASVTDSEPMPPGPLSTGPLDSEIPVVDSLEQPIGPAAEPPLDVPAASLGDSGSLSWLDEGEAEAAAADARHGHQLFEDEAEFFNLAAELQDELQKDADFRAELTGKPAEQSLEEIVEGFKRGVAENLSEEDYDTHFNLGIAYREMGLIDEAIGEFQLAAKDAKYLVACCSMLGLCFQDKGLPELAVKWYSRGLEAPSLSEEETLGLYYDMGNAYMAVGDLSSARRSFVEIFGINSTYRDVLAKLEELDRDR